MGQTVGSPFSGDNWKKNVRLACICILIGLVIYAIGWAKYPVISVLISLGVGFTIRLSRFWLATNYPNMKLATQYAVALILSFLVWGLTPILLSVIKSSGGYVDDLQQYLGIFFVGGFIMVVVSFIYYRSEQTSQLRRSLYQFELEQVQKDKLLLETQLRLLQSQIEPHFLFNTLANIQALIAVDAKQASKMLSALTSLLRQSLDRTRTEWLTLGHELRFNKAYLAIQKIRLGDRLHIEYDVTDKITDDILFPPMLLQPIIENAVTHGIEQIKSGGTLKLIIKRAEQNVIIIVSNDCNIGGSKRKGTNVGLKNVQQRMEQLYGDQAKLVYDDSQAGQVRVTLEVPINVSTHKSGNR
ncbi:sensor histidine kinase [Pseudoalteromonas piscicida]|uniref:Histidine kinase n=1 Tax=Pseudoalteromonas piscicida TaxID=43662 RepID=A0AAD0RM40_PSEO7|nr:histidine kinase [Pseudoalteromonas piscicida]ASD68792.1 histidine kinase [Pseudoalteromonas piscicida]AXQ99535.1 histidine kinase [Pseudoalteromonas piscicida]AXR03851.1 histidine kinase [Pseudoalteromonas piscicida]